MTSRISPPAIALLFLLFIAGCGDSTAPQQQSPGSGPYVVAVNNPLYYFAGRLLGDAVKVRLPVPGDTDPAGWTPAAEDVLQLQGAELVLLNGAGYSGWLDKVSLPRGKLVVTAAAARDRWIELQGQVTHSHGPGGEHAHGGYAFTTWLDFSLARVQAEATAQALQSRWPRQAEAIAARLEELLAELDELDAAFAALARRLRERQLIFSHPVYQYFERRYDLPGHSLHWEPDVMPDEEAWRQLRSLIAGNALLVWEGAPAREIAKRLEATGVDHVVLDPGANRGESDWLSLQWENLERLTTIGQ